MRVGADERAAGSPTSALSGRVSRRVLPHKRGRLEEKAPERTDVRRSDRKQLRQRHDGDGGGSDGVTPVAIASRNSPVTADGPRDTTWLIRFSPASPAAAECTGNRTSSCLRRRRHLFLPSSSSSSYWRGLQDCFTVSVPETRDFRLAGNDVLFFLPTSTLDRTERRRLNCY